ncbi:ASCH domain-containing protein [Pedobacter alpinus]|uniref:ASCH domain-containing protein n=1 Tax=Pedobacter alpinus TaxID=1590643 RepID=A0ABW5TVP8_9SPHI
MINIPITIILSFFLGVFLCFFIKRRRIADAQKTKLKTKNSKVKKIKIATPQLAITRAISVRQPYAEMIILGLKKEEYRSIPTNIRERIYIYASNTLDFDKDYFKQTGKKEEDLERGYLIGTVEIVECKGTKEKGFAWQLENPERLITPIKPLKKPQPVWFKPF